MGELGLWYSEGQAPQRELGSVRTHDEVVRAALSTATPLPLRFGSLFRDLEAVEAELRQRRDEFLESFARVRGRVEMSILLTAESAATTEAPAKEVRTGREFLELRRAELSAIEARRERAERLLGELSGHFDPILLPSVTKISKSDPRWFGTVFHLVPRDGLRAYRERVAAAQRSLPDVTLRVTGPWAPYSFV